MLLAACQSATDTGDTGTSDTDTTDTKPTEEVVEDQKSERCGDMSRLADEIFMYNWSEYIDPEIIAAFEEECGVKVTETNFDSNETLLATL